MVACNSARYLINTVLVWRIWQGGLFGDDTIDVIISYSIILCYKL